MKKKWIGLAGSLPNGIVLKLKLPVKVAKGFDKAEIPGSKNCVLVMRDSARENIEIQPRNLIVDMSRAPNDFKIGLKDEKEVVDITSIECEGPKSAKYFLSISEFMALLGKSVEITRKIIPAKDCQYKKVSADKLEDNRYTKDVESVAPQNSKISDGKEKVRGAK